MQFMNKRGFRFLFVNIFPPTFTDEIEKFSYDLYVSKNKPEERFLISITGYRLLVHV